MLSRSMTLARALDVCLRLVLVLALGLGPAGAAALAASLHAPLCACAGCGPAGAEEGCCPADENEPSAPRVSAEGGACPCARIAPDEPGDPAVLAGPVRSGERAVGAQPSSPPPLGRENAAAALDGRPPGRARPTGPPGVRRAHGAERAAALGILVL
jgi:hypothetical protein